MDTHNPLPTRVSAACDRCRRNKSRVRAATIAPAIRESKHQVQMLISAQCDAFRPCSLCLRADAHCRSTARSSLPASNGRAATCYTQPPTARSPALEDRPQANRKRQRRSYDESLLGSDDSNRLRGHNRERSARPAQEVMTTRARAHMHGKGG